MKKAFFILVYILCGLIFGLALTKSEAVSWYRMQEMFYFQSFRMYGIFMCAILIGAVSVWLIKRYQARSLSGVPIVIPPKKFHHGLWIGGLLFGIGWAFTGTCVGPLIALVGTGLPIALVILLSALAGTWVYSYFKGKLWR
jgi:hypothetical protein